MSSGICSIRDFVSPLLGNLKLPSNWVGSRYISCFLYWCRVSAESRYLECLFNSYHWICACLVSDIRDTMEVTSVVCVELPNTLFRMNSRLKGIVISIINKVSLCAFRGRERHLSWNLVKHQTSQHSNNVILPYSQMFESQGWWTSRFNERQEMLSGSSRTRCPFRQNDWTSRIRNDVHVWRYGLCFSRTAWYWWVSWRYNLFLY